LLAPSRTSVGVDTDQRANEGRVFDDGNAQVGNLQVGRTGTSINVLDGGIERFVGPETRSCRCRGPQETPPAESNI
jgi:hypothetical protein